MSLCEEFAHAARSQYTNNGFVAADGIEDAAVIGLWVGAGDEFKEFASQFLAVVQLAGDIEIDDDAVLGRKSDVSHRQSPMQKRIIAQPSERRPRAVQKRERHHELDARKT